MAACDDDKQHVITTRPGDDEGNNWGILDVPLHVHLVEQVHNMVLSPHVLKLCERANYTNSPCDILHADTHVM